MTTLPIGIIERIFSYLSIEEHGVFGNPQYWKRKCKNTFGVIQRYRGRSWKKTYTLHERIHKHIKEIFRLKQLSLSDEELIYHPPSFKTGITCLDNLNQERCFKLLSKEFRSICSIASSQSKSRHLDLALDLLLGYNPTMFNLNEVKIPREYEDVSSIIIKNAPYKLTDLINRSIRLRQGRKISKQKFPLPPDLTAELIEYCITENLDIRTVLRDIITNTLSLLPPNLRGNDSQPREELMVFITQDINHWLIANSDFYNSDGLECLRSFFQTYKDYIIGDIEGPFESVIDIWKSKGPINSKKIDLTVKSQDLDYFYKQLWNHVLLCKPPAFIL